MSGYPRPCRVDKKDVDARHKAGHDEFLAPHLMVRDGASAPPHHEGVARVPTSQVLILRRRVAPSRRIATTLIALKRRFHLVRERLESAGEIRGGHAQRLRDR